MVEQGSVKKVEQAKVVVFACGLEASSTETKGTVLIRTGEELMSYNKVYFEGVTIVIFCVPCPRFIACPTLYCGTPLMYGAVALNHFGWNGIFTLFNLTFLLYS